MAFAKFSRVGTKALSSNRELQRRDKLQSAIGVFDHTVLAGASSQLAARMDRQMSSTPWSAGEKAIALATAGTVLATAISIARSRRKAPVASATAEALVPFADDFCIPAPPLASVGEVEAVQELGVLAEHHQLEIDRLNMQAAQEILRHMQQDAEEKESEPKIILDDTEDVVRRETHASNQLLEKETALRLKAEHDRKLALIDQALVSQRLLLTDQVAETHARLLSLQIETPKTASAVAAALQSRIEKLESELKEPAGHPPTTPDEFGARLRALADVRARVGSLQSRREALHARREELQEQIVSSESRSVTAKRETLKAEQGALVARQSFPRVIVADEPHLEKRADEETVELERHRALALQQKADLGQELRDVEVRSKNSHLRRLARELSLDQTQAAHEQHRRAVQMEQDFREKQDARDAEWAGVQKLVESREPVPVVLGAVPSAVEVSTREQAVTIQEDEHPMQPDLKIVRTVRAGRSKVKKGLAATDRAESLLLDLETRVAPELLKVKAVSLKMEARLSVLESELETQLEARREAETHAQVVLMWKEKLATVEAEGDALTDLTAILPRLVALIESARLTIHLRAAQAQATSALQLDYSEHVPSIAGDGHLVPLVVRAAFASTNPALHRLLSLPKSRLSWAHRMSRETKEAFRQEASVPAFSKATRFEGAHSATWRVGDCVTVRVAMGHESSNWHAVLLTSHDRIPPPGTAERWSGMCMWSQLFGVAPFGAFAPPSLLSRERFSDRQVEAAQLCTTRFAGFSVDLVFAEGPASNDAGVLEREFNIVEDSVMEALLSVSGHEYMRLDEVRFGCDEDVLLGAERAFLAQMESSLFLERSEAPMFPVRWGDDRKQGLLLMHPPKHATSEALLSALRSGQDVREREFGQTILLNSDQPGQFWTVQSITGVDQLLQLRSEMLRLGEALRGTDAMITPVLSDRARSLSSAHAAALASQVQFHLVRNDEVLTVFLEVFAAAVSFADPKPEADFWTQALDARAFAQGDLLALNVETAKYSASAAVITSSDLPSRVETVQTQRILVAEAQSQLASQREHDLERKTSPSAPHPPPTAYTMDSLRRAAGSLTEIQSEVFRMLDGDSHRARLAWEVAVRHGLTGWLGETQQQTVHLVAKLCHYEALPLLIQSLSFSTSLRDQLESDLTTRHLETIPTYLPDAMEHCPAAVA